MNSLQNSEFLPIEGRFPCKGGACRERAGDNQRESPLAKNAAPQRRSFAQAVLPRGSKPFACGRAQINRHTPPGLLGEPGTARRTWDRPANPGSPDKSRIVRRSSPNEPGARRFQQAEQGPSATAPVPRGRTRRPYPMAAYGARTPWPHTAPVPRHPYPVPSPAPTLDAYLRFNVFKSAQSRCFNLSSAKSAWNDSNATTGRPSKRTGAFSGSFAW